MTNRVWIVLMLTAICGSSNADTKADAKAAFIDGVKLFTEEKYPEALTAFKESYRLRPKVSVLFNIGMCQKALYRYVDSIATFKRFLAQGGGQGSQKNRGLGAKAEAAIAEMQKLVGSLVLNQAPDGAEIKVGGKLVGRAPLKGPVFLDPGTHLVEVTLEGYEPLHTQVKVSSGVAATINAALTRIPAVLKIRCNAVDALVRVDGAELGGCPFEGKIEPGNRAVRVEAPGKVPFDKTVELKPGETAMIEALLVPEGSTDSDPAVIEPEDNGVSKLLVSGLITGGIGMVGVGIGGYYSYRAFEHVQEGKDAVQAQDHVARQKAVDALEKDNKGMIVGFTAGGALVVTGLVLVLIGLRDDNGPPSNTESLKTSQGAPELRPAPGGLSVTF